MPGRSCAGPGMALPAGIIQQKVSLPMTLSEVERLINSAPGAVALHEIESINVSPVGCKEASPCVMLHLKLGDGSFAEAEMPPDAARQLASMLQRAAERTTGEA